MEDMMKNLNNKITKQRKTRDCWIIEYKIMKVLHNKVEEDIRTLFTKVEGKIKVLVSKLIET